MIKTVRIKKQQMLSTVDIGYITGISLFFNQKYVLLAMIYNLLKYI